MRTLKKLTIAWVTLASLNLQVCAQEVNQIKGRVIDVVSGSGVAGVQVELTNTSEIRYTDSEGKFLFNGIFKKGEPYYSFRLFKEGYLSRTYNNQVVYGSGAISGLLIARDEDNYLWITVKDAITRQFIENAEVSVFEEIQKTNDFGQAVFKLSQVGSQPVSVAIIKDCYLDRETVLSRDRNFSEIELIPDPSCNKKEVRNADIILEDNIFSLGASQNSYLRVLFSFENLSEKMATDISGTIVSHFGDTIIDIQFNGPNYIYPHDMRVTEIDLKELSRRFPDSLTICFQNQTEGTTSKNFYAIRLTDKNHRIGYITYRDVEVIRKSTSPFECLESPDNYIAISEEEKERRIYNQELRDHIFGRALGFLLAIELKDLKKAAPFMTPALQKHLQKKATNSLPEGFDLNPTIISLSDTEAYIKVGLTMAGMTKYMREKENYEYGYYRTNPEEEFDFMQPEGFFWIAKMIYSNNQWLFAIYGQKE